MCSTSGVASLEEACQACSGPKRRGRPAMHQHASQDVSPGGAPPTQATEQYTSTLSAAPGVPFAFRPSGPVLVRRLQQVARRGRSAGPVVSPRRRSVNARNCTVHCTIPSFIHYFALPLRNHFRRVQLRCWLQPIKPKSRSKELRMATWSTSRAPRPNDESSELLSSGFTRE